MATIDPDGSQRTLTHYIAHRRAWARRTGRNLELPDHLAMPPAERQSAGQTAVSEYDRFEQIICSVQDGHDFVVIDTPPHHSSLIRLAHAMTDALVGPINDGFIDLDILAAVDPVTFVVTELGHYAELVREARRHRRLLDGTLTDWVVVRNRLSLLVSGMQPARTGSLDELALRGLPHQQGVCRPDHLPRAVPARPHRTTRRATSRPSRTRIRPGWSCDRKSKRCSMP